MSVAIACAPRGRLESRRETWLRNAGLCLASGFGIFLLAFAIGALTSGGLTTAVVFVGSAVLFNLGVIYALRGLMAHAKEKRELDSLLLAGLTVLLSLVIAMLFAGVGAAFAMTGFNFAG